MRLIIEECTEVKPLVTEGKDGERSYFLEGVCASSETKNRNGRVYPKRILFGRVRDHVREYVERNRSFGELGHPPTPVVNPDRVSHMFTELKEDGNDIWSRAKVMTALPMGQIVKGFIDEGGQLGLSTRGMGTLKPGRYNGQECKIVQDDFRLSSMGDVVLDPSAHNAFVQGITEGVEWIMQAGEWVPQYRDEFRSMLDEKKGPEREAAIVESFERFIRRVGRK